MFKHVLRPWFCSFALLAATVAGAASADNPFLGGWDLTIPGGGAGWLGVREDAGALKASLLWGGGSVMPLDSAKVEDGKLVLTRKHEVEIKDAAGKKSKKTIVETLTATLEGDNIKCTTTKPRPDGNGEDRAEFSGRRNPPMPPAPDLKQVKFGKKIRLFNGKNLTGWRLTDPNAVNGWSARDGDLVNNPAQVEGQPHKNYGNLRTDREFEDFNLTLEARVGNKQNSGIYLRGIYEVQVADTYGKPLDSHNMGAIYSRIKPTQAVERQPGYWQKLDITLVQRHVTILLNENKIIDNQPIEGCTGGALWSDTSRPGPIYLQGDHTGIEYRNIVLRPVK